MGLLLTFLALGILDILPILPDPFGHWCSTLRLLTGVSAFIAWLWWSNASYAALTAMGDRSRGYGDALWCWFIPVLNLFRPFQVLADLWRRSAVGNRTAAAPAVPLPIALIASWASLLAFVVLWIFGSDLTRALARHSETLVSVIDLLRALAPLAAAAFGYLVVSGIDQMQNVGSAPLLSFGILAWLTPESIGVASAALLLVSSTGVLGLLTRSPESSINALGDAYLAKDLDRFKDYFDTQSVIYNEFFQEINDPAKVQGEGPGGVPLTVFRDFNMGFFEHFFSLVGPFVAKNATSLVVTGQPDSFVLRMLDDGPNGWIGSPLQGIRNWGSGMANTLRSTYRGVSETRRYGDIAVVKIRIVPEIEGKPVETSMTLQMLRVHNHWRVVALLK